MDKEETESHRRYHYAAPLALHQIAQEIGMIEAINRHTKKRGQDISVGEYLYVITLNRALNPRSKRGIRRWYERTILPFLIQEHEGNKLPKKGNNKAKRFDLNQINLALLVTKDEGIPLMHHTYEGNRHDAKKFPGIIRKLTDRFAGFSKNVDKVTIVFDKGNNSKNSMQMLDKTSYHFVGSLKPHDYKHFLEIPLEEFQLVQRENEEEKEKKDEISAYRARKEEKGV